MPEGYVEVSGWKELRRELRYADKDVRRAIGHANRNVGRKFISEWLTPRPARDAVGTGRGAKVSPSATKSGVVLRAGGKHRGTSAPGSPWGRVATNRDARGRFTQAPDRPYIRRSVEMHKDDIGKMWLAEIGQVLGPKFADREGF